MHFINDDMVASIAEKRTSACKIQLPKHNVSSEHLLELGLQVQAALFLKTYILLRVRNRLLLNVRNSGKISLWNTIKFSWCHTKTTQILYSTPANPDLSPSPSFIFPPPSKTKFSPWSWRKWVSLDATPWEKDRGRAGSLSQTKGRRRKWSVKNKVVNAGLWIRNIFKLLKSL